MNGIQRHLWTGQNDLCEWVSPILRPLTVTQCLSSSCVQLLFHSQRINRCDGLVTGTTHWRHMLSNNNTSYSDPFQSLSASHNSFSRTVKATALFLTLQDRLLDFHLRHKPLYTHTHTNAHKLSHLLSHRGWTPDIWVCFCEVRRAVCLSIRRAAATLQTMACRR